MARKIDAPIEFLPAIGRSPYDAEPHVEIRNGELFYVVVERGKEIRRDKAVDLDDLLYLIFKTITFDMACRYLIRLGTDSTDQRSIIFSKQEELLGILNEEWKLLVQVEHAEV
ncbi:MAG: hypothetical protein H3C54_00940 [Taibaiella sp.]|nr:hypothetical protein [Taibaiella sp.]